MRLTRNLIAVSCLSLLTVSQCLGIAAQAQGGGVTNGKMTKAKAHGNDFDGDPSLNMFQVEPTVINERYYTSGQAEHHQYVGNVLPAGAEIPDNEGVEDKKAGKPATGSKPVAQPVNKPVGSTSMAAPSSASSKFELGKLDSQVIDRLSDLQNIKNDSPALKLKLHVSAIDLDLQSHLKALKVDIISSVPASGDMVVYAPARNVGDVGHLKEVMMVSLAQ